MIRVVLAVRAVLAVLAALLLTSAAHAQYALAQPAPLYPYAAQPDRPYAIEVAPGTYVIHRARNYPYVRCINGCDEPTAAGPRRALREPGRRVTHNDPALIAKLRRHARPVRREVVNTTKIVRDKPLVIEHQRVVDDPPRVIEHRRYVDDAPPPKPRQRTAKVGAEVTPQRGTGKAEKRVIRAEAEVTILGPDRMSIRLFRKRAGADAKAKLE